MPRKLICFILLIAVVKVFAQPANDACTDAIFINTLETELESFNMSGATYDSYNGSCSDDLEATNFWFKFESHGDYVKIITVVGLESTTISLLKFTGGSTCDFDNYEEVGCGNNVLELDDILVDGEEYFICISSVPAYNDIMSIWFINPDDSPPPAYDEPCDALEIEVGDCVTVNNNFAEPSSYGGDCVSGVTKDVWLTCKIPPSGIGFTGTITSTTILEDFQFGTGIFPDDCDDDYVPRNCEKVSSGFVSFQYNELVQNNTYHLDLTTNESVTGDIEICLDSLFRTSNDSYCTAQDFQDGDILSGNILNTMASYQIAPLLCSDDTHALYYRFEVEEDKNSFTFDFMPTDFNSDVVIAMGYSIGNCFQDFILIDGYCGEAVDTTIEFKNLSISAAKYYYLVVAGGANAEGSFGIQTKVVSTPLPPTNNDACGAYDLTLNAGERINYNLFAEPDTKSQACDSMYNSIWYSVLDTTAAEFIKISHRFAAEELDSIQLVIGYFDNDDCSMEFHMLHELCSQERNDKFIFDKIDGVSKYFFQFSYPTLKLNLARVAAHNVVLAENNDVCDAFVVKKNIGIGSSKTSYALPDDKYDVCGNSNERSVWYQYQNAGQNQVLSAHVYLGLGANMPFSVAYGYFIDSLCNNEFVLLGEKCDMRSSDQLLFETDNTMHNLYFKISYEGFEFENQFLDLNEVSCPKNDKIEDVQFIWTLDGRRSCRTGCNQGASPEINLDGCGFNTEGVVWYGVKYFGQESYYHITISGATFANPSIQSFRKDPITNELIPLSACVTGSQNQTELLFQNHGEQQIDTVFIAVSNAAGASNGGLFDICIEQFFNLNNCNLSDTLIVKSTSLGSPLSGPYQAGEEVEFCYTLNSYSNALSSCQYLQGIVPIFGDCWDSNSFSPFGEPISNVPPMPLYGLSQWAWYDDVHYNYNNDTLSVGDFDQDGLLEMCHSNEPGCPNTGVKNGTRMPPGWYASNPIDGPPSGHPDLDYGDGEPCNAIVGDWNVCFTLKTRVDSTNIYNNCDVKIYTLSDIEVGSRNGFVYSTCDGDFPVINCYSLACSDYPTLEENHFTVCSNEKTNIDLNLNSAVQYISWDPIENPNISALESGVSDQFIVDLENTADDIQTVVFLVELESAQGCKSEVYEISVDVLPPIKAEIYSGDVLCESQEIQLGGNPTIMGGVGSGYSFQWFPTWIPAELNPSIILDSSQLIALQITDSMGCSAYFEQNILLASDVYFIVGKSYACSDEEDLIFEINGLDISTTELNWTVDGAFYSTAETIVISSNEFVAGHHQVSVSFIDSNNCQIELEQSIYLDYAPQFNFNFDQDSVTVCASDSLQLHVENFDPSLSYTYHWTTPTTSQFEPEIKIGSSGIYSLLLTNEFGCISEDSLYIEVNNLPVVSIVGDSMVCDSAKSILMVNPDFENILWSNGEVLAEIEVSPGEYSVQVYDSLGCESNDSFSIISEFSPISNFEYISNELEVMFLNLSIHSNSFLWDFGDGNSSVLANPIHTYNEPGNYQVVLLAGNGVCPTDSVTIEVLVNPDFVHFLNIEDKINLYPIPSDGNLNLEISQELTGPFEYSILNQLGEKIKTGMIVSDCLSPCIHALHFEGSAGVYYFILKSKEKFITKIFIIQ